MKKFTSFAEKIRNRAESAKKKAIAEENAKLKAMKTGELDPESEGWEGIHAKENAAYELPDSFDEYGLKGARVLQAFAKSAYDAGGQPNALRIPQILHDTYQEKSLANLIEKDYEVRTPEKGGMFVMNELLWNEFIPVLRAHAPILELGARVFPMKGSLSIPGMAAGHSAEYIGELSAPAKTEASFNDIKMDSKKLATKTAISFDLLEETSYDVLEQIRNDLIDVMGEKFTRQGLYGTQSKFAPGGLLADTSIQKVNMAGAPWDQTTGLKGMQLLWEANIRAREEDCGWMMSPALRTYISGILTSTGAFVFREEMNSGRHQGSPYSIYNGITTNTTGQPDTTEAIFGLWREFIIGVARELEVSTSNEAAFKNNAGQMVSAWDIEAVLLKLVHKHDFAVRRSEAFVHFYNIGVADFEE